MKDKFLINGLGGERMLNGSITVGGAKNAALKLMAASMVFRDAVILKNIPDIEDVRRMAGLLVHMGAKVAYTRGTMEITPPLNGNIPELATDIAKRMRASVVLTGPLLARYGKVSFPHPGGCVIGARPIDLFTKGFEKMGAKISSDSNGYTITAAKGKKLNGAELFFSTQSVTATETFMLAAVLATGTTVIKNAALEPEVVELARFLAARGANIRGIGTPTLMIKGGALLSARGKAHTVMPDRIEAGSFLILGALAARELEIKKCDPAHLESLIDLLRAAGVKMEIGKTTIKVSGGGVNEQFRAVNIKTHEYPGFPTDLQAPMTVFLTQVSGESMVFETIFEGRLNYVESLERMGAQITTMDTHRVMIKGPSTLRGKVLESPDLRAGLAFVIAAIIAEGDSVIHNVYNIDRGYERLEERLRGIGVDIRRTKGEEGEA